MSGGERLSVIKGGGQRGGEALILAPIWGWLWHCGAASAGHVCLLAKRNIQSRILSSLMHRHPSSREEPRNGIEM